MVCHSFKLFGSGGKFSTVGWIAMKYCVHSTKRMKSTDFGPIWEDITGNSLKQIRSGDWMNHQSTNLINKRYNVVARLPSPLVRRRTKRLFHQEKLHVHVLSFLSANKYSPGPGSIIVVFERQPSWL